MTTKITVGCMLLKITKRTNPRLFICKLIYLRLGYKDPKKFPPKTAVKSPKAKKLKEAVTVLLADDIKHMLTFPFS